MVSKQSKENTNLWMVLKMKIEIGESLFYSWLRHVKQCQIVQNNWKISSQWDNKHEDELVSFMGVIDNYFFNRYNYNIFKNNVSIKQLFRQAECDVLGIAITDNKNEIYAVDVAFHEGGLNYGSKELTIMKVVEKCVRTAFCIYGYLDNKEAKIIFASPKINPSVLYELKPCFDDLQNIFNQLGFSFEFRLIANEEFDTNVLKPILFVSDDVADTSELFMRSYQLFKMFDSHKSISRQSTNRVQTKASVNIDLDDVDDNLLSELKIGEIARKVFAPMLENGAATVEEIEWMQNGDYSKQFFGLNYPVLIKTNSAQKESRYYSQILNIYGEKYRLCSEWFENAQNNDRPYLLKWIAKHQ